jgi:endonuclease/exonuclease/phosphatase family metal-dependent hydrolase
MKKIVSLVLFIVSLCFAGCSHGSEKDAIKALTFNIRYDNPEDGINAWTNRISLINNFISEVKPDIMGLQEVLWRQYEVLDTLLKDYKSVGVGREDGARQGEMNPVFYLKDRFNLVRTITFWLSETPEVPGSRNWGSSLPRIVTWLELVDSRSKKHFYVFNTHFAHDSDSARKMSSRILLSVIQKTAGGYPFIVTGDFNMLPYSTSYSILTGPDESVPLLKDSYFISEKKPSGPAYTTNGFEDRPGNGRVDYVFVKNGMKVLDHQTFIRKENDVFLSDHWPVMALVSIN